ncbi:MAG: PqqD family protein [Anaerolineales bacterium]|nr:PqqD family protein [Anaerolineales bacterium]
MEQEREQIIFRINTPRVVYQTIDNETIIIDFDNGAYFSAEGVGAEIWEGLAKGIPVGQIQRAVAQRYAGEEREIQSGVGQFIASLQRESLILHREGASADPGPIPDKGIADAGSRPAFLPPQLRKYTDMQDLLLLDPIHEVDNQGWPIAKDEAAG